MEHNIEAPHDGVVKKVHCNEGGRVAEGVLLIELEAEAPRREPPRARHDHRGRPARRPPERGPHPPARRQDRARSIASPRTGLTRIEAASFVSPKAIPQMADAAEVMAGIDRVPGITYIGLVPNERGARNAIDAKVDEISVVVSASESHNRSNVNRSVDESLEAVTRHRRPLPRRRHPLDRLRRRRPSAAPTRATSTRPPSSASRSTTPIPAPTPSLSATRSASATRSRCTTSSHASPPKSRANAAPPLPRHLRPGARQHRRRAGSRRDAVRRLDRRPRRLSLRPRRLRQRRD